MQCVDTFLMISIVMRKCLFIPCTILYLCLYRLYWCDFDDGHIGSRSLAVDDSSQLYKPSPMQRIYDIALYNVSDVH